MRIFYLLFSLSVLGISRLDAMNGSDNNTAEKFKGNEPCFILDSTIKMPIVKKKTALVPFISENALSAAPLGYGIQVSSQPNTRYSYLSTKEKRVSKRKQNIATWLLAAHPLYFKRDEKKVIENIYTMIYEALDEQNKKLIDDAQQQNKREWVRKYLDNERLKISKQYGTQQQTLANMGYFTADVPAYYNK